MKILVLGATGRAGSAVVERALAAGHEVTAFLRDSAKLKVEHPNLCVVQGDAHDYDAVAAAVANQDAVVNALSTGTLEPTTALSDAARNLIRAMEQQRVRRLVTLFASAMITGRIVPQYANINAEHKRVLQLLQASSLEWVAVCPPTITDEARTGHYRRALNAMPEPNSMRISRLDLADAILAELQDHSALHQLVGVVN